MRMRFLALGVLVLGLALWGCGGSQGGNGNAGDGGDIAKGDAGADAASHADGALDAAAPGDGGGGDGGGEPDGQVNEDAQVSGDGGVGSDGGVDPGPFPGVPGRVVYWRESPISHLWPAPNRIYTASPSIVVLPSGDYLIAFNLFGGSLSPPAEDSGTTYLYRSSDKGLTWTSLTPSPMMDMKRGSLFVFGGEAYLWGYRAAPGEVIIRRSTDNGTTWTLPVDEVTGLLTTNTYGGTPHNPVFFNDRLWTAVAGKRVMSISTTRDFLERSRWAGPSGAANTDGGPLGSGLTISEAQIVASPESGVVLMPKVDGLPYTVLVRAVGNASVESPADEDWVALPGGEKKFGAAYDPVSGRFYVLSNPVLAVHANHPVWTPQLIRNAAAMLSSRDLKHWDVEKLFLYSSNIDYEAFQYLNFDVDGDDMVIASRTAFDIGGNKPPRGHDSNLITFHRIPGFRNAAPDHFLTIDGSAVRRFEQTQHAAAPLGSFVVGSVFAGAPLGTVTGMGQGADGHVYIQEAGGRILRFDALGNFIDVVASAPVTLQSTPLSISQPARGERAWTSSDGGDWEDLERWYYWGRPDTNEEVANLGSAITATSTLTLTKAYTMKGLRFQSPNRYILDGSGQVEIASQSGPGIIEILEGVHRVRVPVRLHAETLMSAQGAAELGFAGGLDLNGQSLFVEGPGLIEITDSFAMQGGRLILDGLSPLVFGAPGQVTLDGDMELLPDPSLSLSVGSVFQLFDVGSGLTGAFVDVILPALTGDLQWDTSKLYSHGSVEIVSGG